MIYPTDDSYIEILNQFPQAEVYWVGGCVRDMLLGKIPSDIDYVVTGLSESDLSNLGWEGQGVSFYVFIHPRTKSEIALARTERKIGLGYDGFDMRSNATITIEEDLQRRDLTINSMAINCKTKELIDPYGGRSDIEHKIFRPTSSSFQEDPVRSLRVARFAARFGPDWNVHVDIFDYTYNLKASGEFDTIPSSRILNEIQLALHTTYPSLFFLLLELMGLSDLYGNSIPHTSPGLQFVNTIPDTSFIDKLVAITTNSTIYTKLNYCVGDGTAIVNSGLIGTKWFVEPLEIEYAIRHLRLFNHAARLDAFINASIINNPLYKDRLLMIKDIIYNVSKMSLTSFMNDGTITSLPDDKAAYGLIVMESKIKRVHLLLGKMNDTCSN